MNANIIIGLAIIVIVAISGLFAKAIDLKNQNH